MSTFLCETPYSEAEIVASKICELIKNGAHYNEIAIILRDAEKYKPDLVMATNAEFPPYEYIDGDMYYGIDVEVAKIIADKLGYDLKIANVAFDSIIPGVQTGKFDMGMAGMTVTPDRIEMVDFSDSYATGVQAVIVAEDGKIQAIEDLDPYYLPKE